MTTPEDRFYNPARINFWFAVSAVLACAGAAGAILKDYADRDWKAYQDGFFSMEKEAAAKAIALKREQAAVAAAVEAEALALVRAGGAADGAILDDAAFEAARRENRASENAQAAAAHAARLYAEEARRREADETIRAETARLRKAIADAEHARARAEMDKKSLQSDVDERKFQMDHAAAHGHDAEAKAYREQWSALVAREAEARATMEAHEVEKMAAERDLKAVRAPVTAMEARSDILFNDALVGPAERRMAAFRFEALRDAPFMEVLAPVKRIQQRVYRDLPVELPFGSVPRVDRCDSCHMGIAKISIDPDTGVVKPLYTAENTPERVFRTHPRPELFVSSASPHSIDKVGCTVCHDGQGYGLTFNSAYHTPSTPEQEAEWAEKYHWHRGESWEFPMLPLKYIEASCAKCHRDPAGTDLLHSFRKDIPGASQWNAGKRLVERSGCYGCHKIDGYVTAGLDKEVLESDDPVVTAERLASSIGKTGPALGRVASKLPSKEIAFKWIWNPKALRPDSHMPRIFGLVNNSGVDPATGHDYDARSRAEVWGIVEYLWANGEKWAVPMPRLAGDAARGKALVGSVGCIACHSLSDFPHPEGGPGNDRGPDLSTVGSKVSREWLYGWLLRPEHYWSDTRMPSLRLTPQEAMDATEYLMSLRSPADSKWSAFTPAAAPEALVRDLAAEALAVGKPLGFDARAEVDALSHGARLATVGRRAIEKYGCFGCHDIPGFEQKDRIGTQLGGEEGWGSKDVDRLDFGLLMDPKAVARYADSWGTRLLPKRRPEWARMKLLNPRVFDAGMTKKPGERLVMPQFDFTETEADAVVTFLLSLQTGEIAPGRRPRTDPRRREADRMEWVARQFNCYGCHTLTRHEVVEDDGSRTWRAKGGDIRPWLVDENGRENKDLWPPTLGGEGRARTPAERRHEEALREHAAAVARGESAGPVPVLKALRPWEFPGAVGQGTKTRPEWLFRFLHDPGKQVLRPWLATRMPTFPFTETELNILVRGFAAADGVPFPYTLGTSPSLDAAGRADARALFDELQCAKCHPTAGAVAAPGGGGLAPDLTYSHDRLRPEWIRLWLDDPARLQPGTKMPPFWRMGDSLAPPPGLKRDYFPAPAEGGAGAPDPHGVSRQALRQIDAVTEHVIGIGAPKK